MSSTYRVLANHDILAYICDYHTKYADAFILKHRNLGLVRRLNNLILNKKSLSTAVYSGNLCAVKLIYAGAKMGLLCMYWPVPGNEPTEIDTHSIMGLAILSGHLNIVQWLHENLKEFYFKYSIDAAAEYGHLEIIKWIHANIDPESYTCTEKALELAALHGHIHVMEWLHANTEVCQNGAYSTRLDVLQWLHQNIKLGYYRDINKDVAALGDLETLKWLHSNNYVWHTLDELREILVASIVNNHIHIVEWLLANDIFSYSLKNEALISSSRSGSIDTVKWVYDNIIYRIDNQKIDPKSKWEAVNYLSSKGNLEIIKFLHRSDVFAYNAETFTSAAKNGHLHVIEWLFDQGFLEYTNTALIGAVRHGHLDIVKWIYKNCRDRAFFHLVAREAMAVSAATNNHIDMLVWLHETFKGGVFATASAIDGAAENGHLDVIKWLHKNATFNGATYSIAAIQGAAANGRVDILEWILDNLGKIKINRAAMIEPMLCAIRNGHLDVLQWIDTNYLTVQTLHMYSSASINGHLHILKWLYESTGTIIRVVMIEGSMEDLVINAITNNNLNILEWLATISPTHFKLALLKSGLIRASAIGNTFLLKWACKTYSTEKIDYLKLFEHVSVSQDHLVRWLYNRCITDLDWTNKEDISNIGIIVKKVITRSFQNGHYASGRWLSAQSYVLNKKYWD